MKISPLFSLCIGLLCIPAIILSASSVEEIAQVHFAQGKIDQQIQSLGLKVQVSYQLDQNLEAQAYSIKSSGDQVVISGGCANGLMYGGLELAERMSIGEAVGDLDLTNHAHIKKRGLKFNIPLDARCPSYDDTGDAAQLNIEHMWDFEFWRVHLDRMAEHRYNVLSLWTPNPFQVMVKLPDYPELALDDVCVTTSIPQGRVMEWDNPGGVNDVVLDNLKIVKKMTIDEKIEHWGRVFDYAHDRGIEIYLITWNIYLNGTYGQYGLTESINNEKTIEYYRQATRVLLETYPQIKGIGVTAGERMHTPKGADVADLRERWLWETYGLGILDYKKSHPEREIPFLHRVWYTDYDTILKYWGEYPDAFDVGYKYVKARIYSSPQESPFIGSLKQSLKDYQLKCWWNLRNDDIYVYRWGDPDYAREFLSNLPKDVTAGYHMGADGYVFGRVFSDKANGIHGSMEIDKHWYKFLLWGRLGYDPNVSNEHFVKLLNQRYDTSTAKALFDAWQSASKIIPQVNRYMFFHGDRHWAPEMCASRESFRYAPDFRVVNPMPGTGILSPKNFLNKVSKGEDLSKVISPSQVALNLHELSDYTLAKLPELKGEGVEFEYIKADIEAFAWLGKYYAQKIEAAVLMEAYASSGKPNAHALNVVMAKATDFWLSYAELSSRHYHTQMYSRVQRMDWDALADEVRFDQQIVAQLYDELSLEAQIACSSDELSIEYPHKGQGKWVYATINKDADAELAVYDSRGEMVLYYKSMCKAGGYTLIWEDINSIGRGSYTLVLRVDGKTTNTAFEKP